SPRLRHSECVEPAQISTGHLTNNEQIAFSRLRSMLGEVGLADLPAPEPHQPTAGLQTERSESANGSPDRTKVSLGDSVTTTSSMTFV
ncbi:unnamed protein product, partial [Leptidea sinapis]